MEIFASIMIIASIALPVLAVVALLAWAGMYAYSWMTDCRGDKCEVEAEEPKTVPAPTTMRSRRVTAPAA